MPGNFPKELHPLQLNQFHAYSHNLLDECYRQNLSSAVVGPNSILMHLAFEMVPSPFQSSDWFIMPDIVLKSPQEIVNICNLPDRWALKRFVDENSHLVHIANGMVIHGKVVEAYYVPRWLRGFFFDPNRCQSLYSTSWVINKCQRAIEGLIQQDSGFYLFSSFFVSKKHGEIPGASHLLEHARNGSDRNELMLFLEYLSKVHWLDIYNAGQDQRRVTNGIIHWVFTTLVG